MFETLLNAQKTQENGTNDNILVPNADIDLRSEQRQKCYKTGQIILGDYGPIYNCVIKDLSWYGVRLHVDTFIPLPKSFKLSLNIGPSRRAFYCKPIWSSGHEIGVVFDHDGHKQNS